MSYLECPGLRCDGDTQLASSVGCVSSSRALQDCVSRRGGARGGGTCPLGKRASPIPRVPPSRAAPKVHRLPICTHSLSNLCIKAPEPVHPAHEVFGKLICGSPAGRTAGEGAARRHAPVLRLGLWLRLRGLCYGWGWVTARVRAHGCFRLALSFALAYTLIPTRASPLLLHPYPSPLHPYPYTLTLIPNPYPHLPLPVSRDPVTVGDIVVITRASHKY